MSRIFQITGQIGGLLAGLLLATSSFADVPAGAPAGATGLCKDGTYWTNATKRGACHGHKGIQTWYASADAAGAAGSASTASTAARPAAAAPASAPAPAAPAAPPNATGQCKDGTYWTSPTKKGACSGHQGVQTWNASPDAGTASGPPPPAAAAAAATAPASPAASTKSQAAEAKVGGYTPPANAAPGGGPGLVWVNKSSKVYHCPADRWYGKTKNGAYMSEADAKAQGNRADHGKACQ